MWGDIFAALMEERKRSECLETLIPLQGAPSSLKLGITEKAQLGSLEYDCSSLL